MILVRSAEIVCIQAKKRLRKVCICTVYFIVKQELLNFTRLLRMAFPVLAESGWPGYRQRTREAASDAAVAAVAGASAAQAAARAPAAAGCAPAPALWGTAGKLLSLVSLFLLELRTLLQEAYGIRATLDLSLTSIGRTMSRQVLLFLQQTAFDDESA